MTATRDRIAWRLSNAALRIATPWYRSMLQGALLYGLDSAAADAASNRPVPPPWRSTMDVEIRTPDGRTITYEVGRAPLVTDVTWPTTTEDT